MGTAVSILTIVTSVSALAQQSVYKSIGPDGDVIYSSKPPTDRPAERVELPPGPSPEQQAAAHERLNALQERLEAQRLERQQARAQASQRVEKAEQAVRSAQEKLAEARTRDRGPEDWQTLASGGRVPSDAYRERVEAAETELEQAKRALRRAREAAAR